MISVTKIDKWEYKIYKPVEELARSVLNDTISYDQFQKKYKYHSEQIEALKNSFIGYKTSFEKHGVNAVPVMEQVLSPMSLTDVLMTLDSSIERAESFEFGLRCMKLRMEFYDDYDYYTGNPITEAEGEALDAADEYIKFIAEYDVMTVWQWMASFGGRWKWWERKK